MNPINTKGFYINYTGEPTAGIQDAEWQLKGDFEFDDWQDYLSFYKDLLELFERVSDTPIHISTFEEIEEEIAKENQLMNPKERL